MQQQNIPIGTLVDMYKRGEMRLPEIQRHDVWRATRVRDLLDSLYRGAAQRALGGHAGHRHRHPEVVNSVFLQLVRSKTTIVEVLFFRCLVRNMTEGAYIVVRRTTPDGI
jgi:hypothetical protein